MLSPCQETRLDSRYQGHNTPKPPLRREHPEGGIPPSGNILPMTGPTANAPP
ncbi:MAG: hypothetical protein ACK55Z_21170 [bacterium]